MTKDRVGIIDIGTNTFNLLIVDRTADSFHKVWSEKEGVGLGLGGVHKGLLAADAIERGKESLKKFLEKCKELETSKVKAFATSAVRDASNKEEFLSILRNDLKLEVEVISGAREAELIHRGVLLGYNFPSPALIMDIGGGSTEFIFANSEKVIKSESFNIGSARMFQMFELADPMTVENHEKILQYLEMHTTGFFENIQTDILIGSSGSFETFYAMVKQKAYPENEFEDLSSDEVMEALNAMIASTLEERMKNDFIIPIRKMMAPIAAIKIKWIIEKLNIKTLTISPFAMKEGVIQMI